MPLDRNNGKKPVGKIRNLLRNALLDEIDSVKPLQNRYKFFVLDNYTRKLLKILFEPDELLTRGISSIEKLESKREFHSDFEAIYFISNSIYSIECLYADCCILPRRYSAGHIFFCEVPSDEVRHKLSSSNFKSYIRSKRILNNNFYPEEDQLYSFRDPCSLLRFYNNSCMNLIEREITNIVQKLVGLCVLFREYPVVRYYKPPNSNYDACMLSYMLATAFQRDLDEYLRAHPEFIVSDGTRPRSVFIIVDRSMDLFTPLLHEFTYQAMAQDLLPIKNGNEYKFKIQNAEGEKEVIGEISDSDDVWREIRHLHMQEATKILAESLDKLKRDNPNFANPAQAKKVSDVQDMLAGLNEFQFKRDKFSLYIQMAEECMNIFGKTNLNEVSDLEQTYATGITYQGRNPKEVLDMFISALDDSSVPFENRARLLAIFLLYKEGIIDSDFSKLYTHSQISEFSLMSLKNLDLLGAKIIKGIKEDSFKLPKYSSNDTGDVFQNSRFIPGLKNILEKHIKKTLDLNDFPYVKDQPPPDDDDLKDNQFMRAPRQRAVWAHTNNVVQPKQRIFVYVSGGMTYAEARSAYEISNAFNKEVILGSSEIITPSSWMNRLSLLRAPRESLRLPEDIPPKQPPDSLFERPIIEQQNHSHSHLHSNPSINNHNHTQHPVEQNTQNYPANTNSKRNYFGIKSKSNDQNNNGNINNNKSSNNFNSFRANTANEIPATSAAAAISNMGMSTVSKESSKNYFNFKSSKNNEKDSEKEKEKHKKGVFKKFL